jgi:hypothetical protein
VVGAHSKQNRKICYLTVATPSAASSPAACCTRPCAHGTGLAAQMQPQAELVEHMEEAVQ